MIDMLVSRFLYVLCWRNKVVIILIILSAFIGMLITLSYHSNKHASTVDEVLRNGKGHIPLDHHLNSLKKGKGHHGNGSLQEGHHRDSGGGFQGQHVQRKFLEKDQMRFNALKDEWAVMKPTAEQNNHDPESEPHDITVPKGRRYHEGQQTVHNSTGYKRHIPKPRSEERPTMKVAIDDVQMHPLIGDPNVKLPAESDISERVLSIMDKPALEEILFEKPEAVLNGGLRFQNVDNANYESIHPLTVKGKQSMQNINHRMMQVKSLLKNDEAGLKEYPVDVATSYATPNDISSKQGSREGALHPKENDFLKAIGIVHTEQSLVSEPSKLQSSLGKQSPQNQMKKMNPNQAWWKQKRKLVSDEKRKLVSDGIHSMKNQQQNVEISRIEGDIHFQRHSAKLGDRHGRHGSEYNQHVMNIHRNPIKQKKKGLTGSLPTQQLVFKGDVMPKHLTDYSKQRFGSPSMVFGRNDLPGAHKVNGPKNPLVLKEVRNVDEHATQDAVGVDGRPRRRQKLPALREHVPKNPDTPNTKASLPNASMANTYKSQANISSIILALARQRKPALIFSPHHASVSFRQKGVWPEMLEQWLETEERYCDGHLTVMNSEFAVLKDVIIDRNFCHGRNGGEEIHEVLNQPEDEEYYTYFHGFFQVSCPVKPQYFFNNNNHLNHWLYSLNSVRDAHLYSEMRQEFTIAIVRYEYANLYHTITDFYNAFLLMEYFNKTQVETNILIIDGHPKGALDPVWDVLFNSSRRIDKQSTRTKYSHLAWSILGYNSPIMDHYAPNIPLVEEFRTFFLSSYRIKDQRKLACDKINILFIWRRDYIAHPRNPSGSISRKIQNEQELVVTLRQNFPLFSVKGVQIDLFEMDQQLAFITETDILIGMHGAGLTHAMFLPKHAGMIELLPTYWSAANEHFHAIARWRHLHYRQWVNSNPQNEAPNHYTKIPPEVLNDLVTDMVKIVCGLATDPPDVFVEK